MTTADFAVYVSYAPPEVFAKMIECLGHDLDCNCWADPA